MALAPTHELRNGGLVGEGSRNTSSSPPIVGGLWGALGAVGHFADTHGGLLPDSTGLHDIAKQYGAPFTTLKNAVHGLTNPAGAAGDYVKGEITDSFKHPGKHIIFIIAVGLILFLILKGR